MFMHFILRVITKNIVNRTSVHILTGLILLLGILYHPWNLYFLNDDFIHIPLSIQGVFGQNQSVRVINDISLWLDGICWGNNATGYHFTNLLLHITCCILMFCVICHPKIPIISGASNQHLAVSSVVIFGLYPFHTEAVFWIIGRGAMLSTIFLLSSIWWLLSGNKKRLPFAMFAFFFGLFTYESVAFFPLFLSILGLKKRSSSYFKWCLAAIWFTLIVYLAIRWLVLGQLTDPYESGLYFDKNWIGLGTNFFRLLLRSFAPPSSAPLFFLLLGCLMIGIIGTYLLILVKKFNAINSLIWCLLIGFCTSFLPYLALGIDTKGIGSERYLYLPTIFLSVILAIGFSKLQKQVQPIVFGVYFFTSLFFIGKSRLAFQTASSINRKMIESINNLPPSDTLFIVNPPKETYGVPILAKGIPEAIKWLAPTNHFKTLKIIDTNNNSRNYWFFPKAESKVSKELLLQPKVTNKKTNHFVHFSEKSLNWLITK